MPIRSERDVRGTGERTAGVWLLADPDAHELLAPSRVLDDGGQRGIHCPHIASRVEPDTMGYPEIAAAPRSQDFAVAIQHQHGVGLLAALQLVDQAVSADGNRGNRSGFPARRGRTSRKSHAMERQARGCLNLRRRFNCALGSGAILNQDQQENRAATGVKRHDLRIAAPRRRRTAQRPAASPCAVAATARTRRAR